MFVRVCDSAGADEQAYDDIIQSALLQHSSPHHARSGGSGSSRSRSRPYNADA